MKPDQSLRELQHFGEEGGVVPTIDVAATSTFMNPQDMERAFHGELSGCYLYSRHSNPTVNALGKKLAAMDGMEAALGVSSGMAAIYCTLRQLMPQGGHMVVSRTIYGGTYALLKNLFPPIGIKVSFVDINNLAEVEKAITADTKVLYLETMSNPLLRIANIPALSELCKKRNLKFVLDNTFTPLLVTPKKWNVDVVIYSCTKYISGSSDLIAGAIVSNQKFIDELRDLNTGMAMLTGPVLDPRVAHELYLRLDHLPIRMKAHSKAALNFANSLLKSDIPVNYPGLPNHADHSIFNSILNQDYGYGGMVVVDCKSSQLAMKLAAKLQEVKFGLCAVSLGFSRTLLSCPSVSTSSEIPETEQTSMGLSPGLLRMSLGYIGDDSIMTKKFLDSYKSVIG